MPDPPKIRHKFSSRFASEDEFNKYLYKRKNGSAPGINMIPYKVYKACDDLSRYLYNIMVSCYNSKSVPINWRIAREIYIPKTEEPIVSEISHFRSIALLNVEGKIFFGLIAKRLYDHIILKNKFIDTASQKGCMENTPGCWEHMSMVWAALKDARLAKADVSAIWLDIKNAYGSVPHQLIFLALQRYGVSKHFLELLQSYFHSLWNRSFSDSCPSGWHKQQKGIFAGDTISIILFLAAINLPISFTTNCTARKYTTSEGRELPLVRAFMDDINLMAFGVADTQMLLTRCTEALTWARMEYNIPKSRSFVIIKGRCLNTTPFRLVNSSSDILSDEDTIGSIHTKPIKWLGRVMDGSLSDRRAIDELYEKVERGLALIDKSHHKGSQKCWILQYLLIPRIRWPLMIYEVSITVATELESMISVKLRKWLGLHHSVTNLCMYSSSSPIRLPITSLTSIYKSSKVSGDLMLRDSKDQSVSKSCPILETGSSWRAREAVNTAETRLFFNQILGHTQTNKAGLGRSKFKRLPPRGSKEHRKLVSDTVIEQEGEKDFLRASSMLVQCSWTKWKSYLQNNLRWLDVLGTPPNLLSFCIGTTYDALPSPKNLVRRHQSSDPSCTLCHKAVGTLIHSLTCCHVALDQGRITFRHDSILNRLISRIKTVAASIFKARPIKLPQVNFVPEGTQVRKSRKTKSAPSGLLHHATDWKFFFDLGDVEYSFPSFLANTGDRPDICIFSIKAKRVILIELTSSREEKMEEWHHKKTEKYHLLCEQMRTRGWLVNFFAIEVGARGYCAPNVLSCLLQLGFTSKLAHTTTRDVSMISMQSSFTIWLASNSREWTRPPFVGTPDNPVDIPSVERLPSCNIDKVSPADFQVKNRSNETSNPSSISKNSPLHPVTVPTTLPPRPIVTEQTSSGSDSKSKPKKASFYSPRCVRRPLGDRPLGLSNAGNTCYANAILQALRAVPEFWNLYEEDPFEPSVLAQSFLEVMAQKRTRKSKPEIPYKFLDALTSTLSTEEFIFEYNRQHDAHEIILVLLEKLMGANVLAQEAIQTDVQLTSICNKCCNSTTNEISHPVLSVPVASTIQDSFAKFLKDEPLLGENMYDCLQCGKLMPACRQTRITRAPLTLVVQLKRFSFSDGESRRDNSNIKIFPNLLTLKAVSDGIIIKHSYRLRATINHQGSLDSGHYWALVANSRCSFLKCDDFRVFETNRWDLNSESSYLLFFSRAE